MIEIFFVLLFSWVVAFFSSKNVFRENLSITKRELSLISTIFVSTWTLPLFLLVIDVEFIGYIVLFLYLPSIYLGIQALRRQSSANDYSFKSSALIFFGITWRFIVIWSTTAVIVGAILKSITFFVK
jgi:hypothetical protein